MTATTTVETIDRFDAANDDAMPFLQSALDPATAEQEILPLLGDHHCGSRMRLRSIRVLRHKPHRRCLLEYRFADNTGTRELILLGKARAKSTDRSTFHTMGALWEAGFDNTAPDGIMLPEPVAVVPAFQMWLQRMVPGSVATGPLAGPAGPELARRITEAARKLHRSEVQPGRRHTPEDELRILRERLTSLAADRPDLGNRLRRVQDACAEIAAELPIVHRSIHRDFYPDQILLDGPRLYLLDLDLYAAGDPALDIGNFIGHLIEQGLREPERANCLNASAHAMQQHSIAAGEVSPAAIHIYTTLTLARHIHISTRFRQRRHITERLLELCEQRLNIDIAH